MAEGKVLVQAKLAPELVQRIDAARAKTGATRAGFTRVALEGALERAERGGGGAA